VQFPGFLVLSFAAATMEGLTMQYDNLLGPMFFFTLFLMTLNFFEELSH